MSQFKNKLIVFEKVATLRANRELRLSRKFIISKGRVIEAKINEIVGAMASSPGSIVVGIKRQELANLINGLYSDLSAEQVKQLESLLSTVYKDTRVSIAREFGQSFEVVSEQQLQRLLTQPNKGLTLSQRIYANNDIVARKLNTDISRLLFQNEKPEVIKRELVKNLNITQGQAERLFRTETSRFFNEASHDAYRQAGLANFEFLAEADACDICGSLDGKIYDINASTPVPVHPNCRCAILPVVE
jgi:SPP1 gp7 family putative phage head morphogenesis protein